jgi:hypothetical protein
MVHRGSRHHRWRCSLLKFGAQQISCVGPHFVALERECRVVAEGGGECSLVAKDGSGFGLTMRKIGGGAVFCLDRNGDGGSGVRSGRCLFYRGG